jgi:ApbE superfamily uncharacterized protein (UPF0280 family)
MDRYRLVRLGEERENEVIEEGSERGDAVAQRMSGVSVVRDDSVRCIPENPTVIFSYIQTEMREDRKALS